MKIRKKEKINKEILENEDENEKINNSLMFKRNKGKLKLI